MGETQNQTDPTPGWSWEETWDRGDFREDFEELPPCQGSQERFLKVGDRAQKADLTQTQPGQGLGQRVDQKAKEEEGKCETFQRAG